MKKILSLVLILSIVFTTFTVGYADNYNEISAYVTVSQYGDFVKDSNGNDAVLLKVELNGKTEYALDDVFEKLHEVYCPGGYLAGVSEYGAYVKKFWNDESENLGYQVNGGTESVWGLDHIIHDGDYIDVTIYKNWYPDTEAYTKFNKFYMESITGEDVEITLSQAGYDADWNMVFYGCEDAVVTINGRENDVITDFDGNVILEFDNPGRYIVSAKKTKIVNEQEVPAITAPVFVVDVKYPDYISVMKNIVSGYCNKGVLTDENMVWLLADMAAYQELYPDEYLLSDTQKQACVDKIIADAISTTVPSALAKNIIALRSLGYDAKNVYNTYSVKYDIVEKLVEYVDNKEASATNVYTLPYVIIALRQAEGYANDEQINYLVDFAVSCKESWLNNEWGTDAATAMILALAPYYNFNPDVKSAVDEAVLMITSEQDETGLIGNAASTGIALTAFSALGIDAWTICNNDKNLIDGLMTMATEGLDGFESMENSFSTEQGLRGLLAWQLYVNEAGHIMYDFSDYPMNPAYSTVRTISSSGGGGGRVNKKEDKENEKVYEAEADTQETEVAINKNPDVNISPVVNLGKTFGDIAEHKSRRKIEALAERNIINGKAESVFDPDSGMTRAEFTAIITRGLGLPEKQIAVFNDVDTDDWYYQYVNIAYSYGIIKGVSETEFNPDGGITRQEAAVMISRAAQLCGMDTNISAENISNAYSDFTDYKQVANWAGSSIAFCVINEITTYEGQGILPTNKITRAEVAEMLYNMLEKACLLQGVTE